MRKKVLLYSILLVAIIFTPSVFAETNEVTLSFSQGEEKEIPIKEILGFLPSKVELQGINFLLIRNNNLLANIPLLKEPNSYSGEILADGKKIPIAINVNDKDIPFKTKLVFPKREIEAGNNFNFNFDINLLEPIDKIFIPITYEIRELPDSLILQEQKREIIESSKTVIHSVYVPSFLESGKYLLIAKASYKGEISVTSGFFDVKEIKAPASETTGTRVLFIAIVIAIVAILALILFYFKKSLDSIVKNHPRNLRQIYSNFKKTKKTSEAVDKLNKQALLLKRAYRLRVIDKKLYEKAKKEINSMIRKVETKFIKTSRKT